MTIFFATVTILAALVVVVARKHHLS